MVSQSKLDTDIYIPLCVQLWILVTNKCPGFDSFLSLTEKLERHRRMWLLNVVIWNLKRTLHGYPLSSGLSANYTMHCCSFERLLFYSTKKETCLCKLYTVINHSNWVHIVCIIQMSFYTYCFCRIIFGFFAHFYDHFQHLPQAFYMG